MKNQIKEYAFFQGDFRHPKTFMASSKKAAMEFFENQTRENTSGKQKFVAVLLTQ